MTITLGDTVLASGLERSTHGSPCGPSNFHLNDAPGIAMRDFIGADRVEPEHTLPDHGSITFSVTRIFDSVEDAIEYVTETIFTEDVAGELVFGYGSGQTKTVFGERSAVTNRSASQVGVAVAVQYTIEG